MLLKSFSAAEMLRFLHKRQRRRRAHQGAQPAPLEERSIEVAPGYYVRLSGLRPEELAQFSPGYQKHLTQAELDHLTKVTSGRIGGYTTQSRHDSKEITKNARSTFLRRFLYEVDPEQLLPEDERARRAEAARKAYFTRLAYQSAKARRRK